MTKKLFCNDTILKSIIFQLFVFKKHKIILSLIKTKLIIEKILNFKANCFQVALISLSFSLTNFNPT